MGELEGVEFMGVGFDPTPSYSEAPIDSSNIGFQLLKKHGWKEGTGLGMSEQGRLEPVQAYLKKNKRGLGAEKVKKSLQNLENSEHTSSDRKSDKVPQVTLALTLCQCVCYF
ncbi:uncharacterized protein LOC130769093 isoform X2 [Actinidia eriantha]|uniref:uncharacterized protein LOC130769093 isoform X2 n=1 Tax=Actinidia eriantha TaxID=165200 RepID=UPI002589316E|nr:uncharacterized protein LOC130769093 isoform X2 [Actinidia eriantha]